MKLFADRNHQFWHVSMVFIAYDHLQMTEIAYTWLVYTFSIINQCGCFANVNAIFELVASKIGLETIDDAAKRDGFQWNHQDEAILFNSAIVALRVCVWFICNHNEQSIVLLSIAHEPYRRKNTTNKCKSIVSNEARQTNKPKPFGLFLMSNYFSATLSFSTIWLIAYGIVVVLISMLKKNGRKNIVLVL